MDGDSKAVLGVLLAGGQSKRMGKDKATLKISNQTLLERGKTLLGGCDVQQVVVSGSQISGGIPDVVKGKGPLAGIYSVLVSEQARTAEGLLIATVDMPAISSALLNTLLEKGRDAKLACVFHKYPLPLFLPNNDQLIKRIEKVLSSGNLSIKHMLDEIGYIELDSPGGYAMTNVNSPEDWHRFVQSKSESIGHLTNE